MKFRCILFDLDGTILDSAQMIVASLSHALRIHLGHAPDPEVLIAGIGTPLVDQLAHHARVRGAETPEMVEALVKTYLDDNLARHDAEIRIFGGAKDTLNRLKQAGCTLGIVTSKPVSTATRGLDLFDLTNVFDVIVGCDSVTVHKPDPTPVLYALEQLSEDANHTLFVGDSTHDIHAGNRAFVSTAGVLWGPFKKADLMAAKPTYLVESFEELTSVCLGATP